MQNNSKSTQQNAIKLASFSALLLAGVCVFPQEELPQMTAAANEATISVSDEVFKVQTREFVVSDEEVVFESENEDSEVVVKLADKITKKILTTLIID